MQQPSSPSQTYCFTSGAYHLVKQRGPAQIVTACDFALDLGGNVRVNVTDSPPPDRRLCYHCNGRVRRDREFLEKRRRMVEERLRKAEKGTPEAAEYEASLREQLAWLEGELRATPDLS